MSNGYNKRLFNKSNLRGKLHLSRFYWLEKNITRYSPDTTTVLELGCFDAKTISFLPSNITKYHGYDANWEGGLDEAAKKWGALHTTMFIQCEHLRDFTPPPNAFDISICLETLEHLPLQDLEGFISILATATLNYCFVTVPNEKGIVLLLKYFVKKYFFKRVPEKYTTAELTYGFLGKTHKIQRNEGAHKGFNYLDLIIVLKKHFELVKIEGIPFNLIPASVNFTIGIVLKKRDIKEQKVC